jgi:hypothetical protein
MIFPDTIGTSDRNLLGSLSFPLAGVIVMVRARQL